ncbi:MAG: Crp/Fnr family transcriptional regulator [Bradyrhizobium sp.]|nr:Crp/Fnr family transcriptional regulator [Bradyrhizobium sp.]
MPHQKLIARLQAVSGLSEKDRASLKSMPYTVKNLGKGDIIARPGDRPLSCSIVLSGFLCRQRTVYTRNQITSFYVPGDMPDLHVLHLPVMDRELCSVGSSTIASIPHTYLKTLLAGSAGLTNAFWRETLIQSEIHRQWVDNLGSRQALPRVAHVFCEIAARLESVGLYKQKSFDAPFTQETIAEACGISLVHTNRTIQEMRRQSLIEWEGKTIEILRRDQLETLAEFSPSYLHVLNPPRPVAAG